MNNIKINKMRKFTTLVAALLMAVATFAQAPQGFSYQAVVRDAQKAIVANKPITVTVSILQGDDLKSATEIYSEKHNTVTNQNGLFTLVVGDGQTTDNFDAIDWSKGKFFVSTKSEYGESVTQLMSVPYALYAEKAASIDDEQLAQKLNSNNVKAILNLNTTTIVNKALDDADYATTANVKATINNALAVYAKTEDLPEVDLTDYAKTADVDATYAKKTDLNVYAKTADVDATYAKKTDLNVYAQTADVDATYAKKTDLNAKANTADLAKVATTGSYNDLTNKPTIPTVPTKVSAFTNDATYVTLAQLQEQIANLQKQIESLQAFAPKFTKLKIQIVNPYAGNSSTWGYNTATVQFDGETFTSGTKEFDVQVGSAMPLSVSLGTFKQTKNSYSYEYTYTITVNGQPFDNVAETYDRPTGYVYNTLRQVSLTELAAKGMIEGGKTKLSNDKIGHDYWGISENEKDTYYNRSAQQDQNYIYADIVDALPDYDATNNHKPLTAKFGIYGTYRYYEDSRYGNLYFENRLSIALTQDNSYASKNYYSDYKFVGMKNKTYNWQSSSWEGLGDDVYTLGLTHPSNYEDDARYYAPIYAKIPNFVYKMEYEKGEIYKVGTSKDKLNDNMDGQNVGPFVDGENTIVITVIQVEHEIVN